MIDGRPVAERKRLVEGGFCGRCGHHLRQHVAVAAQWPEGDRDATGGPCTGEDFTHGGMHVKRCECPRFRLAYRNVVSDEQAEANRTRAGAYTFNAFPPDDYEGLLLVVHTVRVGDHAHVKMESGRHVPSPPTIQRPTLHYGFAGKVVLRWPEWVKLRDDLEAMDWVRIAEVECPTHDQALAYLDATAETG